MTTKKSDLTCEGESFEESVRELTERFDQLKEQRIKIQTQCESVKATIQELEHSAEEQFGTSDVAELKKQLQRMTSENEAKRAKYEQSLDRIEKSLDEIDDCLNEEE